MREPGIIDLLTKKQANNPIYFQAELFLFQLDVIL